MCPSRQDLTEAALRDKSAFFANSDLMLKTGQPTAVLSVPRTARGLLCLLLFSLSLLPWWLQEGRFRLLNAYLVLLGPALNALQT